MNASRKQIEAKYAAAIETLKNCKTDEEFTAADEMLNTLRPQVIEMEKRYPTKAEMKQAANRLYLRSIGMDN